MPPAAVSPSACPFRFARCSKGLVRTEDNPSCNRDRPYLPAGGAPGSRGGFQQVYGAWLFCLFV